MKITCDLSVTSARHHPSGTSTPWFTPWRSPTSNTVPGLVMEFSSGIYGAGSALGTLASIAVFNRSSDATHIDATGAIEVLSPNMPRIEYDASTLASLGLLLEATRTNKFTQSATPADQTISVGTVPHVLSFYGTGTVTLSGAHVAVLVGGGAYPVRSELMFTPTAGDLTLTLTGSLSSPQLEEGDVASSFIPSLASAQIRADDIATVPLGSWFNGAEGTLVFEGSMDSAAANDRIIEIDSGASTTRMSILWNTVLGKPQFQVWEGGVLQAAIAPAGNSINPATPFRVAMGYKSNDFAVSLNGGSVVTDTSGALATGLSNMRLGRSVSGAQGLMLAESVVYYPARLSDVEIQALSA